MRIFATALLASLSVETLQTFMLVGCIAGFLAGFIREWKK
jgi:hypothetical protein